MNEDTQRATLIIDGLNVFTRAYAAYPQMTTNGEQMGGCVGFLKMMQRIVGLLNPSAVYVVWEGGGSTKRRAIFSEYKVGRRAEKLNRFYGDDIPDSDENRKHQLIVLLNVLKHVPVCQLYVSDCEGDDVIAHMCSGQFNVAQKTIASSDKDMYQLLNDRTNVYNLHKKTFVSEADVLSEFRVTASNFALAKALCGDPSDNIPGVKGLGFRTLVKLFPFLGTENNILIQDVVAHAAAHIDESRLYKRVYESADIIKRNWRLVYLGSNTLSQQQSSMIDHVIDNYVPKDDRLTMLKLLITEGINDFDVSGFFGALSCLDRP